MSADGIRVDLEKVGATKNVPTTGDATLLRSFLDLFGYYRRFIKNFDQISAESYAMASNKENFQRTEKMQRALEELKEKLTSPHVLSFPKCGMPFTVETNASVVAVDTVLYQKKSDGKINRVHFASRTMKTAEGNYSACGREALVVEFGLNNFQVYLLSSEPFSLTTHRQVLQYSFKKKDIYARLARWLNFLAKYEFTISYKPSTQNHAANFLSRYGYFQPDRNNGHDKGKLALVVFEKQADLERPLIAVKHYLLFSDFTNIKPHLKRSAKRMADGFMFRNGHSFQRTALGPKFVVDSRKRKPILKKFHDKIGHRDVETTIQFVTDRFWWPSVGQDVASFVKIYKGCQKSKPILNYLTTLKIPLTGLFHTFSIDFYGPLPAEFSGEKYLLIAVGHLSSWSIVRVTTRDTSDFLLFLFNRRSYSHLDPHVKSSRTMCVVLPLLGFNS